MDFNLYFCLKKYTPFYSKSNCEPQGQKFEKVIDSSILTSLGNIFGKTSFFCSSDTGGCGGGFLLRI